jgi:hypothetical protein
MAAGKEHRDVGEGAADIGRDLEATLRGTPILWTGRLRHDGRAPRVPRPRAGIAAADARTER